MSPRRQKSIRNRPAALARLGLVVAIGTSLSACHSQPVLAFRGARHYAAGSEALERGDGARAISELRLAAELVPDASEIQNHLGLAYLSMGKIARARQAFVFAVELDCDNQAARSNLARLSGDPASRSEESNAMGRRDGEFRIPQPDGAERNDQHGG